MSLPGPYREIKREYFSDEDWDSNSEASLENTADMNPEQIQTLISQALAQQEVRLREEFDARLNSVNQRVNSLRLEAPQVEAYQRISIDPDVGCSISLDCVKSIPEFNGTQDEYVHWRQSAIDAYELFRPYIGSNAHYQAVNIIRNRIKGTARALLSSYNTVLNFDAIIARLDCTYADRTSLRILRQQLEMVRQGDSTLMQYYDEVERKLTLVTNKVVMTHDQKRAVMLNEEVRNDALHSFISGLKKTLRSVVFPAQPKDLPSALALAREAEASIERSNFAATYAKALEDKTHATEGNRNQRRSYEKQIKNNDAERGQERNPHYTKKQGKQQQQKSYANSSNKVDQGQQQQEPMDVDASTAKFRQQTQYSKDHAENSQVESARGQKRPNPSERVSGQRRQRVHTTVQHNHDNDDHSYNKTASREVAEVDDDSDSATGDDSINFLGNAPGYRSSNGSWQGKM